jgi:unsaturated rhamnogalacturonyl hydrolase
MGMKNIIFLLTANLMLLGSMSAQENIYSKPFIKSIMDKVNTYRYTHPWRENDDNWIRGTYYTGVMAAYQSTGDKKYLQQCDAWGEKLQWKVPSAKKGATESGANLLTCAQTWLESYLIQKKDYKIKPVIEHLNQIGLKNPVSEPLTWYFEDGRRYCDALYVCPPVLAMLSKITKDPKYLAWMDSFFWDVYGELYDQNDHLFYRDKRFIYQDVAPKSKEIQDERDSSKPYRVSPNGKKIFWSRGNGWVFAGLARILKYTPTNYANYPRYKELYLNMATELKKRQQPDGFWYPNLDDPKDYGSKETSGTSFYIYGLAWGINNGLLSREDYFPVVEKSWAALVSAISDEGKVQWGQMVGGSPYKILQEDSHEYISGMFLLAGSEMYKLGK